MPEPASFFNVAIAHAGWLQTFDPHRGYVRSPAKQAELVFSAGRGFRGLGPRRLQRLNRTGRAA